MLIFKHRFYWLCELISIRLDSWWHPECACAHCSDLKKYTPSLEFAEWTENVKEKEED
jgi:hypothetical protein